MATSTPPHIYAELLPHIRRISLLVTLPTPSTHLTKLGISRVGNRVFVYHEGITTEVVLPGMSGLKGELLGGLLKEGQNDLSYRLKWDAQEADAFQAQVQALSSQGFNAQPPWSAIDLKGGSAVVCRGCEAVVVQKGRVGEWKDLPSENWAEMMEFWHCHKPANTNGVGKENRETNGIVNGYHGEKGEEEKLAARGYGANSVITAQKGVGFVDLMTVLFSEEDVEGLAFSTTDYEHGSTSKEALASFKWMTATDRKSSPLNVFCSGCSTQLGIFNFHTAAATLFKWKLNILAPALVDTNSDGTTTTFPSLSHCLSAALVATQSRSGSAKMVLLGEKEALSVWVLNSGIKYSCNTRARVPAMKILFRPVAADEEEILLPDRVISDIRDILLESNGVLPRDERTLNGPGGVWSVGLLERWEQPVLAQTPVARHD